MGDPGAASNVVIHSLTLGELFKVMGSFFGVTWAILTVVLASVWKVRTNDLAHIEADLRSIKDEIVSLRTLLIDSLRHHPEQ